MYDEDYLVIIICTYTDFVLKIQILPRPWVSIRGGVKGELRQGQQSYVFLSPSSSWKLQRDTRFGNN